ncbi:helix-turn-helix domain-containing protein [Streptomyces sp. NPDC058155]|uniref:helix-turn-helix domain-containing protein n=1 Tax=Streptomyces sp. NPDC058155 TaxID=3346359 RepID=UPI0036EBBB73
MPVQSTAGTRVCDCLADRFGNAADNRLGERRYPSDMTDAEWVVVRPLLPVPGRMQGQGGQPEAYCHRALVEGRGRSEVAALFRASVRAVDKWWARWQAGGRDALLSRPQGRRAGDHQVLSEAEQAREGRLLRLRFRPAPALRRHGRPRTASLAGAPVPAPIPAAAVRPRTARRRSVGVLDRRWSSSMSHRSTSAFSASSRTWSGPRRREIWLAPTRRRVTRWQQSMRVATLQGYGRYADCRGRTRTLAAAAPCPLRAACSRDSRLRAVA